MAAHSFGRLWLAALLLHAAASHAQTAITSSGLGTTVTPLADGVTHDIAGGTRPGGGTNLFHSFGAFSVGAGDVAQFRNDSGLATSNILGRVTGGATSNIFGTISVNPDFGNANLFLINPAGWVFGATAALDVHGSFHASTADYIRFADGTQFFAVPNAAADNVLTSAAPTAFGFLGATGPILVDGAFLQVPDGQTLSLVAGDVQISGAMLVAPSGRIQIGSFASAGEASTDGLNGNFSTLGNIQISASTLSAADLSGIGGGAVVIRGDQVNINGGSLIDTSGDGFSSSGGPISIRGGQLVVDASTIGSLTFGDANGGAIDLSATQAITITNASQVITQTYSVDQGLGVPPGQGGDIHLSAPQVNMDSSLVSAQVFASGRGGALSVQGGTLNVNGGGVNTVTLADGAAGALSVHVDTINLTAGAGLGSSTSGAGRGGDVNVTATQSISVSGVDASLSPSALFTSTAGAGGDAGQLTVSTPSLHLFDGGTILTVSSGGRAGDVSLSVDTLTVDSGATINSQNTASGGNITVVATGPVLLSGANANGRPTGIFTATCANCTSSGDISVQGRTITVTNGGLIQSGSDTGQPGGGSVAVAASESISISGGGGIETNAQGQDVGPISLSTRRLVVDDGFISATTLGAGHGGSIVVQVGSLSLTAGGQIASSTVLSAPGVGGNIAVNADSVSISGTSPTGIPTAPFNTNPASGIFSTASGTGNGNAGQITVTAPLLSLSDGGAISVATFSGGAAGSVALNTGTFTLTSGATVNSSTAGSGAGGAISVNGSSVSINGTGAGLFSTASSTGNAGMVSVASSTLSIGNGGKLSASTTGSGNAGTIATNVGTLAMASGGAIESSTNSSGSGGSIGVQASSLSMAGAGTVMSSTAASSGNAGQITLSGGSANIADGAKVSVTTSGAGNAGTITANVGSMTVSGGQLDSSTSAAGRGGAINVNAGSVVSVLNGGRVSADSTGAGFTGNITIAAGDHITMEGGSISTRALTSDGGNITLKAPLLVRLNNTQITTSVQSGVGGGGNVLIDPQFVLMNNSTISANAFGGPGGNITIIADNFISTPTALLSASSALSTPGTVQIRSPENNLAGSIAQLPRTFTDASRLLRGACSARHEGAPSSFTLAGRGGVPPEADGYLPSSIASAPSAPLAFALARLDDCAR